MWQELVRVAEHLGIRVRCEDVRAAGGLCVVYGERMIIVPRHKSLEERVELLASELARVNINDLYIAPQARELIERRRGAGQPSAEESPECAREGDGDGGENT